MDTWYYALLTDTHWIPLKSMSMIHCLKPLISRRMMLLGLAGFWQFSLKIVLIFNKIIISQANCYKVSPANNYRFRNDSTI